MKKTKEIQMTLTDEQFKIISEASKFVGTTKASFVRASALKESRSILREESI